MSDEKVVPLKLVTGDAPIRSEDRQSFCPHRHVTLREEAHCVVCDDCEREVDAFAVLSTLAREWERYAEFADSHRREADRQRRILEDLNRRVRNAKSTVRRWEDRVRGELVTLTVPEVVARLRRDAGADGAHGSSPALADAAAHVEESWDAS